MTQPWGSQWQPTPGPGKQGQWPNRPPSNPFGTPPQRYTAWPPQQWQPVPRQPFPYTPRPRSGGLGVIGGCLGVLAVFVLIMVGSLVAGMVMAFGELTNGPTSPWTPTPAPSRTPTPTPSRTPTPKPSPSRPPAKPTPKPPSSRPPAKPTAAPKKSTPPKKPTRPESTPPVRPGDPLTSNKIYPLALSGRCPTVTIAKDFNAYKAQINGLIACQEAAWKPVLAKAGYRWRRVAVTHYYEGSINTPCGGSADAKGWVAFYCSANEHIYFGHKVYEERVYGRLAAAELIVHEYQHHVQKLSGILPARYEQYRYSDEGTRRSELQVRCQTAYTFARLQGFNLTRRDLADLERWWRYASLPTTHGSSTARLYWGPRGLKGQNVGACNTWAAPASKVK